jgi:hypothetical protein
MENVFSFFGSATRVLPPAILLMLFADGAGNFKPAPNSPFATGRGSWRLTLGDINKDGKPDRHQHRQQRNCLFGVTSE